MRNWVNRFVFRYGHRIGALAVTIAAVSPMCCRGEWYQPKEPELLHEIVQKK